MLFVPNLWSSFSFNFAEHHLWHYVLTFLLAILASMLTRIIVGLMAFDMAQIWGPDTMLIALYYATSGSVFPIDLAPQWLQNVAKLSPAYYMTGFPTLVFMGRIRPEVFWESWARGLGVCAVLSLILAWQWSRGVRKFEAIGI
jgi:ABC-2 type transport system permease protein